MCTAICSTGRKRRWCSWSCAIPGVCPRCGLNRSLRETLNGLLESERPVTVDIDLLSLQEQKLPGGLQGSLIQFADALGGQGEP